MAKRLIFMGSPSFAVPSLKALHAAGYEIVFVYTQPPRPAGRGQKLVKTAVHEVAESLGLEVRHPEKLRGDDLQRVLDTPCDVICVVAYGLLLPKALVDSRVCLNVHPSALPRWRGAAPIQHTLMAGDESTEICVMRLDAGMDTGPVYDRVGMEIPTDMSAGKLHDICAEIGAERLCDVVENIETLTPMVQVGEAVLAPKITAEMRRVDWGMSAKQIHDLVRGLSPTPGAVAEVGGEVVKIVRAEVADGVADGVASGSIVAVEKTGVVVACGTGCLRIVALQRPGKEAKPAAEVARGWPALAVGARFT